MRIHRLSLQNFRNHENRKVEWSPHLNVITGPNGAGKTNLIDAVHYLSMTRSFVASSDQYVVSDGESYFMIEGEFEGEIRSGFSVACSYSRGEGKKIFVNGSALDRLSDLIGMVPAVVLSPEDLKLTSEGPSQRRSFIDGFICQISPAYLQTLMSYNKVRRQRNRLLQDFNGRTTELKSMLEPWDMQLIDHGSKIIHKRNEVLDNFKLYLAQQFTSFSGLGLKPDLKYKTFCEPGASADEIAEAYSNVIDTHFEKEVEREQTLEGPHRDEIIFYLGDMELRNYGSQGQHRLFAVALKLAQLFYYSDELDDLPVMLLDDVFGNLDAEKTEILLKTLQDHPGQAFITSASKSAFNLIDWETDRGNCWFHLENGKLDQLQ